MKQDKYLESQLMGKSPLEIEKELEDEIEREITEAKKTNKLKAVTITDFKKVKPHERFDKKTIYRVFNRKQKNETFVNGEQAENMLKYTEDYVVRFYQRVIESYE